jgi:coproporphyrinogen III oxidase
MATIKNEFTAYIRDLQDQICNALEKVDRLAKFKEDHWERPGGGGGRSRVLENGNVFEKGGVSTSTVHGKMPNALKKNMNTKGEDFFACGISLVIHPKNPMVPTVHANYRYFEMYNNQGEKMDGWFGGGTDLTPYYLFEEDAQHFHATQKAAADEHGTDLYPEFKEKCDQYFWNHHRAEARGIGGTFFDYLKPNSNRSARDWQNFTQDMGRAFLPGYLPIVEKRKDLPFSKKQRYWQELRRGRYVEFNLVHDRGTLFGLKTQGRTESILMSLPPRVRWDYNPAVKPESPEAKLLQVLKNPKDWLNENK